jgi:DNA-binding transcriptional ArsR family regulator
MQPFDSEHLDVVFSALSDPVRRAMLARLAQGETSVSELAAPFAMSLPAISRHVRVLEDAGLLTRRREGRIHWLALSPSPLAQAARWLGDYHPFFGDRLDTPTA